MYRYFERVAGVGGGNYIYFWKYKGLSDDNITPPLTPVVALLQNYVILVVKK